MTVMSELALHLPHMQDPQNKLPMPELAFDSPDAQDPQNIWQISEQVPHTSTKRQCLPRRSAGRDAQCRLGFQRWRQQKACTLCTVLSPADKINAISLH